MVRQYILVNSAQSVGSITVDESRIRGQGGPARPQLFIPATVTMLGRPNDSALALTELRASLRPDKDSFPDDTIGQSITLDLTEGFLGWTKEQTDTEHQIELRIPLTAVDIEEIEWRRHQGRDGRVYLALILKPVVEGVTHYNQQIPGKVNANKGSWDDFNRKHSVASRTRKELICRDTP